MPARDAHGRFVVGNSGGPGRPPRSVEDRLIGSLSAAVDNGTLKGIISGLVDKAKAGDLRATRLIFEYLVGMPRQRTDITITEQVREILGEWEDTSGSGSDTDPTTNNELPTTTLAG